MCRADSPFIIQVRAIRAFIVALAGYEEVTHFTMFTIVGWRRFRHRESATCRKTINHYHVPPSGPKLSADPLCSYIYPLD